MTGDQSYDQLCNLDFDFSFNTLNAESTPHVARSGANTETNTTVASPSGNAEEVGPFKFENAFGPDDHVSHPGDTQIGGSLTKCNEESSTATLGIAGENSQGYFVEGAEAGSFLETPHESVLAASQRSMGTFRENLKGKSDLKGRRGIALNKLKLQFSRLETQMESLATENMRLSSLTYTQARRIEDLEAELNRAQSGGTRSSHADLT
ncbi:hypothetical protein I302_102994 [Kwoniella bestiolae CBS 10118]|uniref:Uncharacterized protein n=1 Tax=Kwoniella bestiolae CBS 10118 TaxID=1296100 RepID=A0A1B9GGT9_9TREE|nr:hypothetical protein I302_01690 [Kwoniella bestiolae CBS 10118]OCF30171.1 hypothetical protein I302_01690 [Kwoniella bestiolae CBS 10118]